MRLIRILQGQVTALAVGSRIPSRREHGSQALGTGFPSRWEQDSQAVGNRIPNLSGTGFPPVGTKDGTPSPGHIRKHKGGQVRA